MPARTAPARSVPTELLVNLTLRELRGKFKRTTLGWAWSVVNPVVNLAVYSVVFGLYLRLEPPVGDPSGLHNYPFFLVCALLPWTFLANGVTSGSGSYVANESLVKKVYFPRSVLPTAAVLAALTTFLVELLVLGVALLFVGNVVVVNVPLLLVVVAVQTVFVLGLALALAGANARFRDISYLTTIALNVWFYATPILYPPSEVPERIELLGLDLPASGPLQLNPMYQFTSAYRSLLYDLRPPTAQAWIGMVLAAAAAVVVGVAVHRRLEPRLAEVL